MKLTYVALLALAVVATASTRARELQTTVTETAPTDAWLKPRSATLESGSSLSDLSSLGADDGTTLGLLAFRKSLEFSVTFESDTAFPEEITLTVDFEAPDGVDGDDVEIWARFFGGASSSSDSSHHSRRLDTKPADIPQNRELHSWIQVGSLSSTGLATFTVPNQWGATKLWVVFEHPGRRDRPVFRFDQITVSYETPDFTIPPGAVTDVTATANDDGSVTLTWTVPSTNEQSIEVHRDEATTRRLRRAAAACPGTLIATLPAGTTTYTDTTGSINTAYEYSVASVNPSGGACVSAPSVCLTFRRELGIAKLPNSDIVVLAWAEGMFPVDLVDVEQATNVDTAADESELVWEIAAKAVSTQSQTFLSLATSTVAYRVCSTAQHYDACWEGPQSGVPETTICSNVVLLEA